MFDKCPKWASAVKWNPAPASTRLKLTIETLDQVVKHVQS